jgi:Ser/Thr protein kinase RdoA (MazF antagonist)
MSVDMIQTIFQDYNLNLTQIGILPSSSNNVYLLEDFDGEKFVCKVYGKFFDKNKFLKQFEISQSIDGIRTVVPISNTGGSLATDCGESFLVVYPFVESAKDYDKSKAVFNIGRYLRTIHAQPVANFELLSDFSRPVEHIHPLSKTQKESGQNFITANYSNLWDNPELVYIHSDMRLDNFLFDGAGEILALLDWDYLHIYDKELDIGKTLNFICFDHTRQELDMELAEQFLMGYGEHIDLKTALAKVIWYYSNLNSMEKVLDQNPKFEKVIQIHIGWIEYYMKMLENLK